MTHSRATTLVSLALAATMVTGLAVSQPTLPFALSPQERSQEGRVTKSFRDASVTEVLEWLQSQGVDFVVETSTVPKDKRVTMSVSDAAPDDVVRAVASALGLVAQKNGSVYSFRPGLGALAWSERGPAPEGLLALPPITGLDPEAMERLERIAPELQKRFEGLGEEFSKRFEDMGPEMERRFRERMPEAPAGPEARIAVPRLGGIAKLAETLTEEQWKTHEKKGYLTPDDLTPEQRRLVGLLPKGAFTIVVERDGKRLTLKGE